MSDTPGRKSSDRQSPQLGDGCYSDWSSEMAVLAGTTYQSMWRGLPLLVANDMSRSIAGIEFCNNNDAQ